MARLIDSMHQGLDRVIGVWERHGALIDPGPTSGIETVLAELDGDPTAVLLTHIHLDHAGATGSLVERFPDLPVYVHEAGAPHLIDPGRLLSSAERLWGDDMDRLWGDVLPVPERNLRPLSGGETADGLRVLYTPGHASHHVSYLDEQTGDAFIGDVGGVLIPPTDDVWAPTPPPDIDVELWLTSIEEIRGLRPERLILTHFGAVDDPDVHLDAAAAELQRAAERARTETREEFLGQLGKRIDEHPDGEARRIRATMPPVLLWLGLERYWRKRSELAASPARDSG